MVNLKFDVHSNGICCANLHTNPSVNIRMESAVDTFGFEILYKLHYNEIQKKEDIIILYVHWYLVKCGLRCIGNGDNITFDGSEKGSELLPKNWNTGPSYALRYVKNGKLYFLCGIKSDEEILINFAKPDNDAISNIAFPIEKTVSTLHGPLETMIPSYNTILHQIQKDLLKPICKIILIDLENTKETGTQTMSNSLQLTSFPENPDPQRYVPEWNPTHHRNPDDLRRLGAADLYPGRSGGGMIFEPFRGIAPDRDASLGIPGRLPPNAIPPGARFNPFGPPDLDPPRPHRRRLDDDHLPPPGFLGDMFM